MKAANADTDEINKIIPDLKDKFKSLQILLSQHVDHAGFGVYWFKNHCNKNITKRWSSFIEELVLFLLVWGFGSFVVFILLPFSTFKNYSEPTKTKKKQ